MTNTALIGVVFLVLFAATLAPTVGQHPAPRRDLLQELTEDRFSSEYYSMVPDKLEMFAPTRVGAGAEALGASVTLYTDCEVGLEPFYIPVPLLSEGVEIEVVQQVNVGDGEFPLPWTLLLQWNEPPTWDNHVFSYANKTAGSPETIVMPAPGRGRLFGAVTIANVDTSTWSLTCPAWTAYPTGSARFDVRGALHACYHSSVDGYNEPSSYQPFFNIGSGGACTGTHRVTKLTSGVMGTRSVPSAFVGAAEAFIGDGGSGDGVAYFYILVSGPHAYLDVDITAMPIAYSFDTNVFVRRGALAAPPHVYASATASPHQALASGSSEYYSALAPGEQMLRIWAPSPGMYTIGVVAPPSTVAMVVATAVPLTLEPISHPMSDAPTSLFIGYPDMDTPVPNLVIPAALNGVVANTVLDAQFVRVANASGAAQTLVVVPVLIPPGMFELTVSVSATVSVDIVFSEGTWPVFASQGTDELLTVASSVLAANVMSNVNSTRNAAKGISYIAVVARDPNIDVNVEAVSLTVGVDLHCPDNCNGEGYCYAYQEHGTCACYGDVNSLMSPFFVSVQEGGSCQFVACVDMGSCEACVGTPGCSWCESTAKCLPGAHTSDASVRHDDLCPAFGAPGPLSDRLVIQPQLAHHDPAYSSTCRATSNRRPITVAPPPSPAPPPPPSPTGWATTRPENGQFVAADGYSAQCGSRMYFYGPVGNDEVFAFGASPFDPSVTLCEFWSVDVATVSDWVDHTGVMGDGVTTGPGCRGGAALACIDGGATLVLYGGLVTTDGLITDEHQRHTTDLWELDLGTMTWTMVFPNCYDPHYGLAADSTTPHGVPLVDAACTAGYVASLPNGDGSPERVGGIAARAWGVGPDSPVFASRGVLLGTFTAVMRRSGSNVPLNFQDDPRFYFVNLTAGALKWDRIPYTASACASGLGTALAYEPGSATVIAVGGLVQYAYPTLPDRESVRAFACVTRFSMPVPGSVWASSQTLPREHGPAQRTTFAASAALGNGLVLFGGGMPGGRSVPYDFHHQSFPDDDSDVSYDKSLSGLWYVFTPNDMAIRYLPSASADEALRRVGPVFVVRDPEHVVVLGGGRGNVTVFMEVGVAVPTVEVDLSLNKWEVIGPRKYGDTFPPPRAFGVVHLVPDEDVLVVMGGMTPQGNAFGVVGPYMDEVTHAQLSVPWIFDLKTETWTALAPPPPAIGYLPYMASSCVWDNKVWVFGGMTRKTGTSAGVVGTLLMLDMETHAWTDYTAAMTGDVPPPVGGATALCTADGKMYLLSGMPLSATLSVFNDDVGTTGQRFLVLDLTSRVWTGLPPPPSTFAISPGLVLVPDALVELCNVGPAGSGPRLVAYRVTFSPLGLDAASLDVYDINTATWVSLPLYHPLMIFLPLSDVRSDGTVLMVNPPSFNTQRGIVFELNLAEQRVLEATTAPRLGIGTGVAFRADGSEIFLVGGIRAGDPYGPVSSGALASSLVYRYTMGMSAELAPASAVAGTFNENNMVTFTGVFPPHQYTEMRCGYDGKYGEPGVWDEGAGLLACTLPRGQVGATVMLAVRLGGIQTVFTNSTFEFLPCPAGTTASAPTDPCVPCPLGTYTDTPGATSCAECPPALYTPSTGQAACIPCPIGHVLTSLLPDRTCSACPAGSYSSVVATAEDNPVTTCEQCSTTTYSDEPASSLCTSCPRNSQVGVTGADSRDKCSCSAGFWGNATVGDGSCVACPPAGADCPFLDNKVPIPRRGFWRDPERPERVLQCALAEACPGGKTSVCASGYTGEACSECADQHYPLNGKCEACPKNSVLPLIIAGVIMLLFIILLYKFAGKSGSGSRSAFGSASIALNFIQMTALFTAYKMNWPDEMVAIMKWFSIMNLNLDVASPECALPISYKTKWLITMSIPVVVAVLYVGHMVVRYAWSWVLGATCCAARAGAGASTSAPSAEGRTYDASEQEEEGDGVEMVAVGESESSSDASSSGGGDETAVVAASTCSMCVVMSGSDRGSMANQTLHAYLLFLSLAYVFVSSKSLEVFSCAPQTDGSYYLNAHPSIKCYEGSWWDLVPYAIVAGLVYGAGIPGVFTAILFRVFKRAVNDPDEASYELYMARYGFLTSRYLLRWFAWELTIMGRKMAIIACTLFFQELVIMQNLMAMLVVFASVLLQVYSRPYRNPKDNKLEFILLCTDYFILFLGILFSSDLDDTSATVLTVLGVTVLILSILSIVGYLALEVRRVYYTRRYKAVARENPDLVKRAEFVLTEDAYFSLMEVLKAVEKEDATSYTAVLSELADATRAIRRQEPVAVFVEEVQRTFHVYRQTASEADLALLDAIVLHITQESIATKDGDGGLAFARLARNGALPAASDSSSSLSSASGSTDDGVEPLSTRAPAFPAPSVHTSILPPTPDKDDDDGTGAGVGTRRGARAGRTLASSRQRSPRRSPSPRSSVSPRRSPVEQTPRTTSDNSSPVPPTHGRSGRAPTAAPLLAASASATAAAIAADLADSDSSSELGALNPADFAFRRSATASTLNASVPTTRISRKRV